jgi:Glutamate synthase domain 1
MKKNTLNIFESIKAERNRLSKEGLYNLQDEHDACGVGAVVAIDGKPRREVVEAGIDALKAVWHRGAVGGDGKTGDGAGIHVEIPQDKLMTQYCKNRP